MVFINYEEKNEWPAGVVSVANVAAWRLARFGVDGGSGWLVVEGLASSVAVCSSSFCDEGVAADFRPRDDWRVGGVDTAGDLAFPRGD